MSIIDLHRPPTLFIFVSLFLVPFLQGQPKLLNGRWVPQNFRSSNSMGHPSAAPSVLDTMTYQTLETEVADRILNDGCGTVGADQWAAKIATARNGRSLCAWIDERTGMQEIIATLLDPQGSRIVPEIVLCEPKESWNSEPHVVYNPVSNEFIVLWAHEGYTIRMRRVSIDGQILGSTVVVNQRTPTNVNNPSAGIDASGHVLVTWTMDEYCCQSEKAYARVFTKEGDPLSNEWDLRPGMNNYITSFGRQDRIAVAPSGSGVVAWSQTVSGRSHIVLSPVSTGGLTTGPLVLVSDSADTVRHTFPTVVGSDQGRALILWTSDRGLQGRVYAIDSGFVTPVLLLESSPNSWLMSTAASDTNGRFFIAWQSTEPRGMILGANGQTVRPVQTLTTDPPKSWWSEPHAARGVDGGFRVALGSSANWRQSVHVQSFSPTLAPQGTSSRMNEGACTAWQTDPVVRFNERGGALVVWRDQRDGPPRLMARVVSPSGVPVGGGIPLYNVNAPPESMERGSILPVGGDRYIVTASVKVNGYDRIAAQSVSTSGAAEGPLRFLTEPSWGWSSFVHHLARLSDGSYLLAWGRTFDPPFAALVQRFTADFTPIGTPDTLLSNFGTPGRMFLSVSANARREVLIVWRDYDRTSYVYSNDVKAMVFGPTGDAIGDTLKVSPQNPYDDLYRAEGRFDEVGQVAILASWSFFSTHVAAVRWYSGSTSPVVTRFAIDVHGVMGSLPRIAAFVNRSMLVAWQSSVAVRGFLIDDVRAQRFPFELRPVMPNSTWLENELFSVDVSGTSVAVAVQEVLDPAYGFDIHLVQKRLTHALTPFNPALAERVLGSYPNPGRQSVTLCYAFTERAPTRVEVYDLLGRRLYVSDEGMRGPGSFEVSIPVAGLPNGVYVARTYGLAVHALKFTVLK